MNTTGHLLTCLTAECAGVTASAAMLLRSGPADNSAPLVASLNDLMAAIWLLETNGIIPPDWQDYPAQSAKMRDLKKSIAAASANTAIHPGRELL